MKRYDFTQKIEDMTDEQVKERISAAFYKEMPTIRAIPYIGSVEEVTYSYPELTALCPMTGIQDLYNIDIIFTPNTSIPELKSLKFYFLEYRNLPISHEHLCSKIYDDFKNSIQPEDMTIKLAVAPRGGITTNIVRTE